MAGSAKGQIFQFTPPGAPNSRPETIEDRLEREISEAPYHLGPVRITPILGFRDVAYVRDLFSEEGARQEPDVTATVGAGFRAYLRTGRKVTWIAQALPEYVWWNKRTDSRRLNVSGGLEGVFLLNRLTVDVAASRLEHQALVTPEIPALANTASDLVRLDSELELTPQLRPFVRARWSRQEGLLDDRSDTTAGEIELLDRDERLLRAGLHWYPRKGWTVGLAAERTEADFDRPTLDSSNEGTSPVLELQIDRPRFFLNADLAARSLTATEGSRFVDYDGVTGSISLSLVPRSRLEGWLYANRQLLYSVSPGYPYIEDQRVGLSLGVDLGGRVRARVFAETGDNEFTPLSPASPPRTDDLVAYGGGLIFTLTQRLNLSFQATRIELDSNLPGSDRSYTSGGLALSLRGNLEGRSL